MSISEVAAIAPFELYAIRYAYHGNRQASDNYIGPVDLHDADSNLDYYVWLARRGSEVFLIDTGFDEAAARQRGRTLLMRAAEGVRLLGVDPDTIKDVLITHLHYDHAGTLGDFPSARFHIQDSEVAYATGRCMCHQALRTPYSVEDVVTFVRNVYAGRVHFHAGTVELTSGLSLHLIGGHTSGLQAVRVFTQRGWVVLASDATHLYGNIGTGTPFPIVYNIGDMLEGYNTLKTLAESDDHIVPGHDPLVMKKYPAASAELAGRVARLDLPPTDAPDHSRQFQTSYQGR